MSNLKLFRFHCYFSIAVALAGALLYLKFPSTATFVLFALMSMSASLMTYNLLTLYRKISAEIQREEDLIRKEREHQLLLETVQYYPMPYAVYDDNDQLCVWNKPYEKIYNRVFEKYENTLELKGISYENLLRGNTEKSKLDSEMEAEIKHRVEAQQRERNGTVEQKQGLVGDRKYPGLGWYRVSKYRTPSGGVAGFAVDINELKQHENELLEEIEHRKKLEVEIRKIANTDVLTGISNRRHFLDTAATNMEQARINGHDSAMLMIDIDHFKNINDTLGHACGDEVLKTISSIQPKGTGSEQVICGRLGGEEFAVLITVTDREKALNHAEKMRAYIAATRFLLEKTAINVTVSIGVALSIDSQTTLTELLKQADDALYSAKNDGRNRVSLFDQCQYELNQKKVG